MTVTTKKTIDDGNNDKHKVNNDDNDGQIIKNNKNTTAKMTRTRTRTTTTNNFNDPDDHHHHNLSEESREGLLTLVLWWYGNHKEIRKVLRCSYDAYDDNNDDTKFEDVPFSMLETVWRTKWFAKGELTASTDAYIRDNFGWLLQQKDIVSTNFVPKTLCEKIAYIILFDQVSRNVYRGNYKAYSYDHIALPIALELSSHQSTGSKRNNGNNELPFHFRATIAICLCHSESLSIQETLAEYISTMMQQHNDNDKNTNNHYRQYRPLYSALQEIARKHVERVVLFGRFPERNLALGRKNTTSEEAFLAQLR